MTTYEHELAAALEAAALAGRFIRTEYETFTPIPDAPASISTHVDRGSQEIILRYLRDRFPGDGLCAEENTAGRCDPAAGSSRAWVVDPIDGTRGFVTKNGEFSVMIALTVGRVPVVGVVLEPVADRVTYASVGGGCWAKVGEGKPARCRARDVADPSVCVLTQSRSKPGRGPTPPVLAVGPAAVLETSSAGVKMALVARSEADVYVNPYPNFHDWDICAGHILVTEAGGRVTGLRGESITYGEPGYGQRRGLVVGTAAIQDAVIERLKDVPLK